jgi:outer membrane biosynthesis protein TonB
MDHLIELEKKDNRNKSILLSFLFHVLLLLLLLLPCLHYFDPPLDNQSIIIALGIPEEEDEQAAASTTDEKGTPEPQVEQQKAEPTKPVVKESEARQTKIVSKTEESSSVEAAAKKSNADIKREQEEARIAEEYRKAEEEAQKKQDAKSKFGSLFNKNSDTDNTDGKGDPISQPDATALEGMSEGFGKTGKGLQSRKIVFQPKIEDNTQKTGKVVVDICVNKSGKVVSANFTQKGSTTTDTYLIRLAESNARKYEFTESDIDEQCGEIIIDFKLK